MRVIVLEDNEEKRFWTIICVITVSIDGMCSNGIINDVEGITPWRESTDLSAYRFLALNRLHNLKRRLIKDSELYAVYHDNIDDYVALGVIRPVSVPGKYFIPHYIMVKRGERD